MSFIKAQLAQKKFGLIQAKKPPAIFSAEEEAGPKDVNEALREEAERKKRTISAKEEQQKVLEIDPSAYDYDEVYDAMKASTQPQASKKQVAKGPQYMQNLIDKAQERKIIYDMAYERKLRKEQEAEGDMYGDKEKFLTGAYRRRLEELDRWKKGEDARDEADVERAEKGGMFNFYANLIENNVAMGAAGPETKQAAPTKPPQPTPAETMPKPSVEPSGEPTNEPTAADQQEQEPAKRPADAEAAATSDAKRQKVEVEISKDLLAEAKQLAAEDRRREEARAAAALLEEKARAETERVRKADEAKARFMARKAKQTEK